MKKLDELFSIGQSVWLDYISRPLLTSGELEFLIKDGVRGMTSNPTIFDKAISGSSDYDEDIKEVLNKKLTTEQIYEHLAFKDIIKAADIMRVVYDLTNGLDGYVSIEVSPELAYDTEQTIQNAKRIFTAIGRPNIMIKIPATEEGLPAIAEVLASGINVNVTLIFGIDNYRKVANAFIDGLEKLQQSGGDVSKISSVASFFVSRVDTSVDKLLSELGNEDLQGKIAVANSKIAFDVSNEIFSSQRWQELAEQGAKVQRLLWASTGTKNPKYSDVLYVDYLIGPNTVNTLPPSTLQAFLHHGIIKETLSSGLDEAKANFSKLKLLGIDLDKITATLQDEGVKAFSDSFKSLLKNLEQKVEKLNGR
jgi:transaldolase